MTVPDSSSSGNGGTNSSGQNSSEEAPEEEEKEESGSQEEGKSEGTGQNSAKDEESKSSTAESPAVQESPSVPESPSGNEPKAQGVAFYTGKGFSIGKSGRYGKPAGEPTAMQAVAGTGMTEEIRIIQIDNTDGKGTYEEFLKAKAKYEMDLAVVSQFKSAGYTAADVGEGRLDSSVANFATQIASMKSQASTLDGNISSIDSSIDSAETSRSTTGDTIDFYEENLKDAQVQYGIQNGQAYQDTAAALQNQIASSEVGIKSAEMQLENYTLTSPYFRCYRTEKCG